MPLTLAGVYDTGIRELYRLAGGPPSSPLVLCAHTGGNIWELDWQSRRIVRRYCPRRPLLQRLRQSGGAEDGVERPLHEVRAIVAAGEQLLVVDNNPHNGQTHLVDLRSGQSQVIFTGQAVYSAACTLPVQIIALGGHRRVTLVAWPGGRLRGELAGHNDGVRDMAFSPDGRLLVSVGGESEDEQHRDAVRLWDVQSLAERQSWMWHHLGSVAFHPAGQTIAVGCIMPAAIKLWDLACDTIETTAVEAPRGITTLHFSPDGRQLWAGDREGRVFLFV
jgi:WD40 repeat protein